MTTASAPTPGSPTIMRLPDEVDGGVGFHELFGFAREHVRLLVISGLVAGALFSGVALLSAPRYTARTSFLAQSKRSNSSLAGFAAQLGVALPTQEPGQSPAFFADLAKTPTILTTVVSKPAQLQGGQTIPYRTYYKVKDADSAVARERVVEKLAADIGSSVTPKTGIVMMSMTAKDPVLAMTTLSSVVAAMEQYNLNTRRSQATAERRFAEQRLGEVRAELNRAEDALMSFLQINREYRNSPTLMFQYDRLSRDVNLKQQVYSTLSQSVEQARLEEVRDTPVLSVVEPIQLPARANSRHIVRNAVLGLLGGPFFILLLVSAWVLAFNELPSRTTRRPA